MSEPDPTDDELEAEDTAVTAMPVRPEADEDADDDLPEPDPDEPDTLAETWEGEALSPAGEATKTTDGVPDEIEDEEEFEPPTLVDEP